MSVNLRPINRCTQSVQNDCDPGTEYVAYYNRKPIAEIAHRDGRWGVRDFAEYSCFYAQDGSLRDIVSELEAEIEFQDRIQPE